MKQPENHHDEHDFLAPLRYPFEQKDWLNRLWWLSILNFIPGPSILNLLILRGWRLEMIRRMAYNVPQPLPDADVIKFLFTGLFLWIMTGLYALVPFILVTIFGVGGIIDSIKDIFTWILLLCSFDLTGAMNFYWSELIDGFVEVAINYSWVALSFPLYRAGMILYALTGKKRSFLHVGATALFIVRHFKEFIKIYLFTFVFWFLMAVLVIITFSVGWIIVPTLYYACTAAEYGFLARRLAATTSLLNKEKYGNRYNTSPSESTPQLIES